ncbi:VOC family protein [Peribacillus glennii]|uniref:VOC family protein n=1 Tax=Peribacillus glennii TaxID=2303991 RepID=A0A372L8M0_9BACI|nr:VOC family protein [Peribacillus glennii]RFU61267.1 VOC family protein [Peribacillus glennii]
MKVFKVLARVYINEKQIEESISIYEQLFSEKCYMHIKVPEMGLELAQVGSILLLAGSEKVLVPLKSTDATFLVDSLSEWREELLKRGAIILDGPREIPTGMNMEVKHSDGAVIEYVQHDKEKLDAINLVTK